MSICDHKKSNTSEAIMRLEASELVTQSNQRIQDEILGKFLQNLAIRNGVFRKHSINI